MGTKPLIVTGLRRHSMSHQHTADSTRVVQRQKTGAGEAHGPWPVLGFLRERQDGAE